MKCAVITPIGPGHAPLYLESCLPSIETAVAYDNGPFDSIIALDMDDGEGQFGRSNRRNEAVKRARDQGIEWVFFLDADDTLTPNAFQAFARCLDEAPNIDAAWGLICESNPAGEPILREGQPSELSDFEGFLTTAPWLAVQIGCFVKTTIAAKIPFDEQLNAGEDYKFYLALWAGHNCRKFPEIFFVNYREQHSVGPRAATGKDWRAAVDEMWVAAVGESEIWVDISFDDAVAQMRITNPIDTIQSAHVAGHFFDEEGLRSLQKHAGPNPMVIDVGANIGNHTVWFCKVLEARKVFPVEPNPVALKLLKENLDQNNLERQIDTRGLGFGLGTGVGRFNTNTPDRDNLGATRLEQAADGKIEVTSLDDLMAGETAELLKIDAEGMELDVLEGGQKFIAESRPIIWVEVLRENQLKFAQQWCRFNRYRLSESWFYVNTVDYLAVPEERF
jgi:FkbM family methyltransferase